MFRRNDGVTIDCSKDKGRTKQSFKKECDINHIMSRYRKTGLISPLLLNQRQAIFADVAEIGDFQECQSRVLAAKEAFLTLPSSIRARFGNDPAQLLDFCSDPKNRAEAIELGIIPKPEKPLETTEKPPEAKKEVPPTVPPPSVEGGR